MFKVLTLKTGYKFIVSKSIWMSDNDFGMFSKNSSGMQDYYLQLFEYAAKSHNHTFRIYLTAHGIRAFVVDAINIPSGIYLLREVSSDPFYVMKRSLDGEFSCRISPKMKNPPEKFAITKYLTTVGNGSTIKEIKEFIELHDSETKAFSGFQLV